jgi:RNase P/RNase MRP subunit POP5
MKPLIPSHKENKRYLLVRGNNVRQNIEKAILEFSGIIGMSRCCLSFIKPEKDFGKDTLVICVNRDCVDLIRASLVVYPEKMEVVKVSGTLKGLGEK